MNPSPRGFSSLLNGLGSALDWEVHISSLSHRILWDLSGLTSDPLRGGGAKWWCLRCSCDVMTCQRPRFDSAMGIIVQSVFWSSCHHVDTPLRCTRRGSTLIWCSCSLLLKWRLFLSCCCHGAWLSTNDVKAQNKHGYNYILKQQRWQQHKVLKIEDVQYLISYFCICRNNV